MEVSEYRKKIEEELRREPTRDERLRGVLNQSTTTGSEGLESASGDDIISATISAALNGDEEPQVRIAALAGVSVEIGKDPELIDAVLGLVADRSEPAAVRRAALDVLRQNSFRTKLFAPKRADYLGVLRDIIDAPDLPLRFSAIDVLAAEKDEYVQRRLKEGLEDPSRALVPPENALGFLGYDLHGDYYPLLREIIENPPNLASKREAARLLGADAASAHVLVGLLRDKGEDPEVRNISAAALQAIAPDAFEDMAREIVLDESEDDNLRALGVTALDHFGNRGKLGRDEELNSRIDELGSGSRTEGLESASGGADSAPTELERAATRFISRRRR
jgi:HEAT repeat protein